MVNPARSMGLRSVSAPMPAGLLSAKRSPAAETHVADEFNNSASRKYSLLFLCAVGELLLPRRFTLSPYARWRLNTSLWRFSLRFSLECFVVGKTFGGLARETPNC